MIASGLAPAIARSLTVPLTASSPIEPPGKRSGLTTKVSVVVARRMPSTSNTPLSPSSSSCSEPNAGTNRPSIIVWVALPPAPWAIVTRSALNFGRFDRVFSMISRILCSRPAGRGFVSGVRPRPPPVGAEALCA